MNFILIGKFNAYFDGGCKNRPRPRTSHSLKLFNPQNQPVKKLVENQNDRLKTGESTLNRRFPSFHQVWLKQFCLPKMMSF